MRALPHVLQMTDRIVPLSLGRVVCDAPTSEFDAESPLRTITGLIWPREHKSLRPAASWLEDAVVELDGARGDGWPAELFDGSEAAGAAERVCLLGVGEEPVDS